MHSQLDCGHIRPCDMWQAGALIASMKDTMVRFAASNGRLSTLRAGAPDAPAVLLIHGLGWNALRLWKAQIAPLVAAGWQVIAPDQRGTGLSEPLEAPVSIPDFADDLAALLAEMDIDAPMLVGFSMGCMTAVDLALRPHVGAAGVVLACGGLRATADGSAATEAMIAGAIILGAAAFAAKQANAVFGTDYQARHPDKVEEFKRWRAGMDQVSLHHAFRAPYGLDYEARLADLSCPVAVIAAAQDAFLPLDASKALAANAGAPLHVIADSGHMATIEQPDAFNDALLSSLSSMR